uniref:Uncharacterized protein n=1 Tax=Riboviria sp. TaxID=2585031 RepID=A0A8K1WQD8_9VIRU|nr:MAG: hypothetical protein 2 [Riboviria sp.]
MNLARARRAKSSTLIAALPSILNKANQSDAPLTLVACGDRLPETLANFPGQWIDIPARVILAQLIAQASGNRLRDVPPEYIQTKIWAELAATWCDPNPQTIDSVTLARNAIRNILIANPPDATNVLNAMQSVITRLTADMGAGILPWDEVEDVAPAGAVRVDNVTVQQFHYYESSAHAFDYHIIAMDVPALNPLMATLNVPSANVLNIPAIQLQLNPNYVQTWPALPIDQMLAILEMVYYANVERYNSQLLAVAIGVVFALGKVAGFTEAWLNSRLQRVADLNPGLDVADKVTLSSVSDFQARYIRGKLDSDALYSFFAGIYPSLTETTLNPLNWVIEQARAQSMTTVVSYSTSMIEFDNLPIILMDKVTDAQYLTFIRAAVCFIIDPWGSLFGPRFAASLYPDIANFGIRAQKARDRAFRKYAGTWHDGGTMSRLAIDAAIQQCISKIERDQELAADPIERLRTQLAGLEVREIDDEVFIFDNSNRELNLAPGALRELNADNWDYQDDRDEGAIAEVRRPDAPQAQVRGARLPETEEFRANLGQARRGWPLAARNLPPNARKINMTQAIELATTLIGTTNVQDVVMEVCPLVTQVSKQVPLRAYGEVETNIQVLGRYNYDLVDTVNAILRGINLTVVGIIPTFTPAAQVVIYNDGTMVGMNSLLRPRRAAINPVVIPPPINQNPGDNPPPNPNVNRPQLNPNVNHPLQPLNQVDRQRAGGNQYRRPPPAPPRVDGRGQQHVGNIDQRQQIQNWGVYAQDQDQGFQQLPLQQQQLPAFQDDPNVVYDEQPQN